MRPGRLLRLALSSLMVTILLAWLAWKAPPPGPLAHPSWDTPSLLWPQIAIVRDGGAGGDRVVELKQAGNAAPTYLFSLATQGETSIKRDLGIHAGPWQPSGATPDPDGPQERYREVSISLGFYERTGKWTHRPFVERMVDDTPKAAPEIDAETLARWRPLITAYLNQRGGNAGDRLNAAFDTPVARHSWLCWQNGVVLLAYLGIVLTILLLMASLVMTMVKITRLPTALQMGVDESL